MERSGNNQTSITKIFKLLSKKFKKTSHSWKWEIILAKQSGSALQISLISNDTRGRVRIQELTQSFIIAVFCQQLQSWANFSLVDWLLLILSVEQYIQIMRGHPEDSVDCISLSFVAEILEVRSPNKGLRLPIVLRPSICCGEIKRT